MKTLSVFSFYSKAPASIVAMLFCLSLQHKLYAPPATPTPTYYGEIFLNPDGIPGLSLSLPTGADLEYGPVPGNPSMDELEDWSIPTIDGLMTPADSVLTSESYGTPNTDNNPLDPDYGFPSFMTSPTLIPLEDLTFSGTGSYSGDSVSVNMDNYGNGGGSVTESDSRGTVTFLGVWVAPDNSNTLALLLFAGIVLAVTVPRRKTCGRF